MDNVANQTGQIPGYLILIGKLEAVPDDSGAYRGIIGGECVQIYPGWNRDGEPCLLAFSNSQFAQDNRSSL